MGLIFDLIMVFVSIVGEQVELHSKKGIDPNIYGNIPDPYKEMMIRKGFYK